MLVYDHQQRISPHEALYHPFFKPVWQSIEPYLEQREKLLAKQDAPLSSESSR